MKLVILSLLAVLLAACEDHPSKPVKVCTEKANVRMVPVRGGSFEAFDCQRWKLTCIEPLELFESGTELRCRLPRGEQP